MEGVVVFIGNECTVGHIWYTVHTYIYIIFHVRT